MFAVMKYFLLTIMMSLAMSASAATKVSMKDYVKRLRLLQDKGIMLGHQDAPFYGTSWCWDYNRSDVKEVCGDYPAVMGFDLGQLELDSVCNLDGVPFERMREEIAFQHERGGIVTISWHAWNPSTGNNAWDPSGDAVVASLPGGKSNAKFDSWLKKVATFLSTLKTHSGETIPVIFRPWHEMHGGWFWWGKNSCTPEQYKALFIYTVKQLKKYGVRNCIYCYSPGGTPGETSETYLRYYPGDKYVDMLGVDIYSGKDGDKFIKEVKEEFSVINAEAERRGKLVCFSETGQRDTTNPKWFTNVLWNAIKDIPMSYVLLWRNAWDNPTENFGPAPEKTCASDFKEFYNLERTLFLSDLNPDYKAPVYFNEAMKLERRMRHLRDLGYMFGHQDDTFYGLTWEWQFGRSDVKELVGDYPAVMGYDLGGIEMGDAKNLDSVPFDAMRHEILNQHKRGGIITISWHPRNPLTGGTAWDVSSDQVVKSVLPGGSQHPKFCLWMERVGNFLKSLKTQDGTLVPIIFRPWHENNGSWFWWGQKLCTDNEYLALWNMLQDYLRAQGLDNLMWSYSPNLDGGWTMERFMKRYPGNGRVTLIGEDSYQWGTEEDFVKQVTSDLDFLSSFANANNKLLAITECGYKNIPDSTWWTRVLKPVLDKYQLCYFHTWRNYNKEYFAPAPGHPSAMDFLKLYNDRRTLFLRDIQRIK